jgi:hypothetical protein
MRANFVASPESAHATVGAGCAIASEATQAVAYLVAQETTRQRRKKHMFNCEEPLTGKKAGEEDRCFRREQQSDEAARLQHGHHEHEPGPVL